MIDPDRRARTKARAAMMGRKKNRGPKPTPHAPPQKAEPTLKVRKTEHKVAMETVKAPRRAPAPERLRSGLNAFQRRWHLAFGGITSRLTKSEGDLICEGLVRLLEGIKESGAFVPAGPEKPADCSHSKNPHSDSGYRWGCRCVGCTAAHSAANRRYEQRKARLRRA